MDKKELRKKLLRKRRWYVYYYGKSASAKIIEKIIQSPFYKNAKTIHTYVALPNEVDTHTLIEHAWKLGKKIIVPRVQPGSSMLEHYFITKLTDLEPGSFHLMEPNPNLCEKADPADAELVFVPGLAFDRNGNRLGYGKGFYDRFLTTQSSRKIGLAFELQVLTDVPVSTHDVAVNDIISEKGHLMISSTYTGHPHREI